MKQNHVKTKLKVKPDQDLTPELQNLNRLWVEVILTIKELNSELKKQSKLIKNLNKK